MLLAAIAGAGSLLVVACGGSDDPVTPAPAAPTAQTPAPAGNGTLRIGLTDAPRCKVGNDDLSAVYVTVERVRVHQSSDAADDAAGWRELVVNPVRRIDLLELTNGRLEELGTLPLPAGDYTQVRMVLSPNSGGFAANAVVLDGQTAELPLQTPSAAQSGLKLKTPFTVPANTVVDLVIDFDACRSIVRRGNGSHLLKPVLRADLRTVAAIEGYVASVPSGVVVSAQKNGVAVRSTVPDRDGRFVLAYLDPAAAPYDVVFTAPLASTAVVAAVPASIAAVTHVSTVAAPVVLPASAQQQASGVVGPAAARDLAAVRALQAVGTVAAVEVAHSNVDPATGAYAMQLPKAAPLLANWSSTLPLVFAAQAASAAQYRLQAVADGYQTQTVGPFDFSADRVQDFTLVPMP